MTKSRTKSDRRQKQKERIAMRRKAKGDVAPTVDLEKKRATVAQVTRVYQALQGQIQTMDETFRGAVKSLYANDEELKNGIAASEFNLRAHQKAINALALEFERIRELALVLIPESQTKEKLQEMILEMANVTLPSEDGQEQQVVRRVNWPYYHEQVDRDLKLLAEEEAKKEPQKEAPQNDGIPEDAVVFGGS